QGADGCLGRGVRQAVRTAGASRQGPQDDEGAAAVVSHSGSADGDWHALHAVQGCGELEVEPAESRHHPQLQPLHRDHRVHLGRRSGRLQLGLRGFVGLCKGGPRLRLPGALRGHQGRYKELESGHRPQPLPHPGSAK
ncbi:unnamed protein product, partial [Symbiodinium sp. CCMP2456]